MISEKITKEQIFRASELIKNASHIVLLTHMSPDGDAMGSSLGLAHFLRSLGKNDVTNIVPNAYPSFLAWMPGASDVLVYETQAAEADEVIARADLLICTDFNEPKRIGALGKRLVEQVEQGIACMVVDHHIADMQADFVRACALTIIDHTSPAASQLVYLLIREIAPINNLSCSTCIYTGLMTDTGNFSYNSNNADLYEIVADLVRAGVDKDAVYNATFNQYSADRMRLMGYCLYQKMRLFPEHHTSLIYLSRKELYKFNFQSGDAEGIVNLPLQIADVHYSVFMREDRLVAWEKQLHPEAKTKVKISFRSQGNRPVNIFAHEVFNGGGHANASGGEFYGASVAEAVQLFLNHYKNYFSKE